ncbi:MAG TPA: hypothetical protein VFV47_12835 [Hyphomicrobiaceae bacterium]|nr:hypothetical protein [Hyphomicrobiaceae bacterium]
MISLFLCPLKLMAKSSALPAGSAWRQLPARSVLMKAFLLGHVEKPGLLLGVYSTTGSKRVAAKKVPKSGRVLSGSGTSLPLMASSARKEAGALWEYYQLPGTWNVLLYGLNTTAVADALVKRRLLVAPSSGRHLRAVCGSGGSGQGFSSRIKLL